jgi:hypothetical protein
MKNRSNASLAAAVLVTGSLPVIALAAAQPLRTLPAQQDIWITGTIQRAIRAGRLHDHPAGPPVNVTLR